MSVRIDDLEVIEDLWAVNAMNQLQVTHASASSMHTTQTRSLLVSHTILVSRIAVVNVSTQASSLHMIGRGPRGGAAGMTDTLIRAGVIVDGSGAEPHSGDVRVRDGLIVEVGPSLASGSGEVIDAN